MNKVRFSDELQFLTLDAKKKKKKVSTSKLGDGSSDDDDDDDVGEERERANPSQLISRQTLHHGLAKGRC